MKEFSTTNMLVIIDGDTLLYRCGFSVEHKAYRVSKEGATEDPLLFESLKLANAYIAEHKEDVLNIEHTFEIEPLPNALHNVKNVLESILDGQFPNFRRSAIYLSGGDNFRKKLSPAYKANRDTVPKPRYFDAIREYMINRWKAISVLGVEADDAMAIHATAWEGPFCIVTNDKDLNQIPGHHYNWVKNHHFFVDENEALYNLYAQILQGDATDCVEGLVGIGPKRAARILKDCTTAAEYATATFGAYQEYYGPLAEEKMLLAARLVYLLRRPDDAYELPIEVSSDKNKNTETSDDARAENQGQV